MKHQKSSRALPNEEPDWHLLMAKLADIENRLAQIPHAPPSQTISDNKLAVIATSIYRTRRRREQYFDEALFGEPCWDMLLDLFANKAFDRRVNVTSLCLAANVPHATGFRYLRLLEEKGLVVRTPAPDDRRVTMVEMTHEAYKQMRRYVVDGIAHFEMPAPD
jgi:predicted transcriptional regulator